MTFVSPTDVKGVKFLHILLPGAPGQQWVWTKEIGRARRLAEAQQDESFFGMDISYRDLALSIRILQWNEQEASSRLEREETLDGTRCHVVTIEPRNAEFTYGRYRLWFGVDDLLPRRVDIFDGRDTVVKRVTFARFETVQGHATPLEVTVADLLTGSHTLMLTKDARYDIGLPAESFGVSALEKSH